jgi:hypothetical protein
MPDLCDDQQRSMPAHLGHYQPELVLVLLVVKVVL